MCLPPNLLQLYYNHQELLDPLLQGWCSHPGMQQCLQSPETLIRVRENQVLFLYLDDYGELSKGSDGGTRYRKIQKLWCQHSITEEMGHAQEANQTLEDIDWEILDFLG
ncbi:E3 ubiquitin-protein ligase UBR2-like [Ictalurus furcatus]|uniref:E3 ubiquitin-protein ligase UBR2-like n=1 Tax=Ictalurus furcatus TaxID=66913 RepID=UPI002350BF95|nr:E3 ubiquitin-protein ligase UBR2-like [Ictalurus furcatus]